MTIANNILQSVLLDSDDGTDRKSIVEWYYVIDHALQRETSQDLAERLSFVKSELRLFIDAMKSSDTAARKLAEENFLADAMSGALLTQEELPQICFDNAALVDDLAWSEDLSPAMVIGIWKMETTCTMYYPDNGDGPFQILSKNVRGDMTVPMFVNEFQDFADFSRNKRDRYARANRGSGLFIDLSYDSLDLTGLVKHGALYNGLSGASIRGNIQPANSNYVWGRYNESYSGANKDGLVANVLKYLQGIKKGEEAAN